MTDRDFRFLFSIVLLGALYVEAQTLLRVLIGVLFLEGFTNWRLSMLATRLRYHGHAPPYRAGDLAVAPRGSAIAFDAERAWRLLVAVLLLLACEVFPDQLWFFPWFMGFAVLGAGLSGVCPMLIALQWAGFRYTPTP